MGSLILALLASSAQAGTSAHTRTELAQAKKSLLVLSDMPKSWTASKSSSNNSPTPDAAELASCLGVPLKEINATPPTVSSKAFNSKEDLETVQDSIEVFPTAKAAQADLAVASNPKAPQVLHRGLQQHRRQESTGVGIRWKRCHWQA